MLCKDHEKYGENVESHVAVLGTYSCYAIEQIGGLQRKLKQKQEFCEIPQLKISLFNADICIKIFWGHLQMEFGDRGINDDMYMGEGCIAEM